MAAKKTPERARPANRPNSQKKTVKTTKTSKPKLSRQPSPRTPNKPSSGGKVKKQSGTRARNEAVVGGKRPTRGRPDPAQAALSYLKLRERYPDAHCELDHETAFQLILATVLSAQSTDVMVNKITPELFERWPTPEALARAEPPEVERVLSKVGMYRQKTRNVIGLSQKLVAEHGGEVPRTLAELIELPGVGRKTANVVLGVAFGAPEGVVVDTHVQRISQRLRWSRHAEPSEIERDLMKLFPKSDWDMLSHTLIFHGRRTCAARKPACAACPVNAECPSAFAAEHVGRKNPGGRRRPRKGSAAKAIAG